MKMLIEIDTDTHAVVQKDMLRQAVASLYDYSAGAPFCRYDRDVTAELERAIAAPRPEHSFCSQCKGECGRTVEEYYDDRIIEVHWVDCEHCSGTGEEPKPAPQPEQAQLSDFDPIVPESALEVGAKAVELAMQAGVTSPRTLALAAYTDIALTLHKAGQQPAPRQIPPINQELDEFISGLIAKELAKRGSRKIETAPRPVPTNTVYMCPDHGSGVYVGLPSYPAGCCFVCGKCPAEPDRELSPEFKQAAWDAIKCAGKKVACAKKAGPAEPDGGAV